MLFPASSFEHFRLECWSTSEPKFFILTKYNQDLKHSEQSWNISYSQLIVWWSLTREIKQNKNLSTQILYRDFMSFLHKSDFFTGQFSVTGWSNWTGIIFDLITPDWRHPMRWDRCPFSHYIWTFWYIVSKNSNRFHTIFTDWCIGGVL